VSRLDGLQVQRLRQGGRELQVAADPAVSRLDGRCAAAGEAAGTFHPCARPRGMTLVGDIPEAENCKTDAVVL
jgi:hypothetical protein